MSDNRTIMRFEKNRENPYTAISNSVLRDRTLSWKARGILTYLLSLPDDWQVYESELVKHATDGRDSLRSGMKELENSGYLVKERIRDENGHLKENKYTIFDRNACNYDDVTTDGFSNVGKSNVGKTNVGKSNVGKSPTTNNLPYEELKVLKNDSKKVPSPEIDRLNEYPNLREKTEEWITYKAERKETYKPMGLKSLITQVERNARRSGEQQVIDLITLCMSNGWKGIIWDKLEQPTKQNSKSFMDIDF